MSFAFGKNFTYQYFPQDDNDDLSESDITTIEGELVNVFIFDDQSKPDRTIAANGTGAIETIGSWTKNNNAGFDISVSAINDPQPTEVVTFRKFWIAFNYRLETGAQIQTIIKLLAMERIGGIHKKLTVNDKDLSALWPKVIKHTDLTQRQNFVNQVIDDIKDDLDARKVEWALIWRHDDLKRATVYKTLSSIALSQVTALGDGFSVLKDDFEKRYVNKLAQIELDYDADSDGDPLSTKRVASQTIVVQ